MTGCATVPVTGRHALRLVSSGQLARSASAEFDRLKAQTPLSNDLIRNDMVRRVGERIAYIAGPDMPNANWEFVVFEDPRVNAFAMPGGKVAIYSGLFEVVETEDDLAVVIGHEIAHVVAGHGAERMSQRMLANTIGIAANLGTQNMEANSRRALMQAYGTGADLGWLLPYSRLHESEADEIGLIYSARAGYDPMVAIDFWKRMEALKQDAPSEFYSTHPADATRRRRLRIIMPRALEAYRKSRFR